MSFSIFTANHDHSFGRFSEFWAQENKRMRHERIRLIRAQRLRHIELQKAYDKRQHLVEVILYKRITSPDIVSYIISLSLPLSRKKFHIVMNQFKRLVKKCTTCVLCDRDMIHTEPHAGCQCEGANYDQFMRRITPARSDLNARLDWLEDDGKWGRMRKFYHSFAKVFTGRFTVRLIHPFTWPAVHANDSSISQHELETLLLPEPGAELDSWQSENSEELQE